jgi:hypothetical protein
VSDEKEKRQEIQRRTKRKDIILRKDIMKEWAIENHVNLWKQSQLLKKWETKNGAII